MEWVNLKSTSQIDEITNDNSSETILILKHSTRCSISSMAMNRLEGSWNESKTPIKTYYLDLIAHRDISNYIADKFSVYHQSPQVLLIKNGDCFYEETHMGIRYEEIVEQIATKV